MRLRVLSVGKGRDEHLTALAERYVKRLGRLVPVTTGFVKDATGPGRAPEEVRRREAEALRKDLGRSEGRSAVIALDERGETPDTPGLLRWMEALERAGTSSVVFVIGGPEGLEPSFRAEADRVLALSRLTLPHEMARLVLVEQLYRAWALRSGHPYHRAGC